MGQHGAGCQPPNPLGPWRASTFEDLTFAEIEARIAACHPDVRALYAYWQSKRHGDAPPRRLDIDPLEVKRCLGTITIVDVVPDARRFVYQLVGTWDVAARGYDPTGKSVAEAFFGGTAEETLSCYEYVVQNRSPFCYRDPYPAPDGKIEQDDIIYLPLSEDGATVTSILVFGHSFRPTRRDSGSAF